MQIDHAVSDISIWRRRNAGEAASNQALVDSIALGDKRAMQVLVARHAAFVYRFVLRLVGDALLAEDIFGEVFLEVWRRADGVAANSRESTWLLAIARQKAIEAFRCRSDAQLDDVITKVNGDPAAEPGTATTDRDRRAIIRECLTRLSPAQREIVDLVYYHRQSVADVARIIGVSISTVKSRMFGARNQMAVLLMESGVTLVPEAPFSQSSLDW